MAEGCLVQDMFYAYLTMHYCVRHREPKLKAGGEGEEGEGVLPLQYAFIRQFMVVAVYA